MMAIMRAAPEGGKGVQGCHQPQGSAALLDYGPDPALVEAIGPAFAGMVHARGGRGCLNLWDSLTIPHTEEMPVPGMGKWPSHETGTPRRGYTVCAGLGVLNTAASSAVAVLSQPPQSPIWIWGRR